MVAQIGASVPGMQVPQLVADTSSSTVKKQASTVDASAQVNNVTGTPTVFVGKTGSKPALVGSPGAAPTLAETEAAISGSLG
jgi:protein-disulfide isomerase